MAGTSTLPNIRNSSTNVETAIISAATGSSPRSTTSCRRGAADEPPTSTFERGIDGRGCRGRAASPSGETGSTDGARRSATCRCRRRRSGRMLRFGGRDDRRRPRSSRRAYRRGPRRRAADSVRRRSASSSVGRNRRRGSTTRNESLSLVANSIAQDRRTPGGLRADSGSTRSSGRPNAALRNGRPRSTSSSDRPAVATATGRRMTHVAMRCQKPDASGCGERLKMRPASTFGPRTASSAGRADHRRRSRRPRRPRRRRRRTSAGSRAGRPSSADERHGDRQRTECDRPARASRPCARRRRGARSPACSSSRNRDTTNKRVVDREPETQRGREVDREDRHVGERRRARTARGTCRAPR